MPSENAFTEAVLTAAATLGRSARLVTDHLIHNNFQDSYSAAERDGIPHLLRRGVGAGVRNVFKKHGIKDRRQWDFADIDPSYRQLARELQSDTYYVESVDKHLTVPELIAAPALMKEAGDYLIKMGRDNIAEGQRVLGLHRAVLGIGPANDPSPRGAAA